VEVVLDVVPAEVPEDGSVGEPRVCEALGDAEAHLVRGGDARRGGELREEACEVVLLLRRVAVGLPEERDP